MTDNGSPPKFAEGWVYINVTNVNSAPTFTKPNQNFTFYENVVASNSTTRLEASDDDGDDMSFCK